MRQYIIYRDKVDNKITCIEENRHNVKKEQIDAYNNNEGRTAKAELLDVSEDSVLYYALTARERRIKDYFEDLKSLQWDIENIGCRVDDMMNSLERKIKEVVE